MILEYKLEMDHNGNMRCPGWIENGGYLQNPSDHTLIGFSPSVREYKIPDSVLTLTVAELKTRCESIPMEDIDGNAMTTQQIHDMVDVIVAEHDIA